jgi:hypothetical protein
LIERDVIAIWFFIAHGAEGGFFSHVTQTDPVSRPFQGVHGSFKVKHPQSFFE